jgi:hypothetical protein
MEYHEYDRRVKEATGLSQAGDQAQASAVFESLADDTSLTDMDRAFMYYNAAVSRDAVGSPDEVERLFDRGIALERPWYRSTVREGKAKWLEKEGRLEEAVAIYSELVGEGWLTSGQRRQFEEAVFRTRP